MIAAGAHARPATARYENLGNSEAGMTKTTLGVIEYGQ